MVVGQCFDVRDSLEALHDRFMYILISIIIIFIVDAISFNNFDLIILKRAPMSLIVYLFFSRILIGSLSRFFFSHLCHDCSYDFLTLNQNALQSAHSSFLLDAVHRINESMTTLPIVDRKLPYTVSLR